MKKQFVIIAAIFSLLSVYSCSKTPAPVDEHEHEEYDSVVVHFIALNDNGTATQDSSSISVDAHGHASTEATSLKSGKKYQLVLQFFHDHTNISHEIEHDGTEHQFFFNATPATAVNSYTYTDKDANNKGIGLNGVLETGSAGTYTLQIILRHGLNKSHSAAQSWNSSTYYEAGGADDLNISCKITN